MKPSQMDLTPVVASGCQTLQVCPLTILISTSSPLNTGDFIEIKSPVSIESSRCHASNPQQCLVDSNSVLRVLISSENVTELFVTLEGVRMPHSTGLVKDFSATSFEFFKGVQTPKALGVVTRGI